MRPRAWGAYCVILFVVPSFSFTWEGAAHSFSYTDSKCTKGRSATPVSTTIKRVKHGSFVCGTLEGGNAWFKQTCAGENMVTQATCYNANCTSCYDGARTCSEADCSLITFAWDACDWRFYKGEVTNTTAGDFLKTGPCDVASGGAGLHRAQASFAVLALAVLGSWPSW